MLTGTIEIVGKDVSGLAMVYRAAPNKALSVVEFAGLGKMEEGTDGEVAWSRGATAGPRLKEGGEKAFSIRGANFHGDLNWRDLYQAGEATTIDTVEGRSCYKVVLTPKGEGKPITRYYDRQSGLVVKILMTVESQQGEISIESLPSDYRRVGELLIPHKIVQRVMGSEIVTTFTRVENNPEISPERFAPPARRKGARGEAGQVKPAAQNFPSRVSKCVGLFKVARPARSSAPPSRSSAPPTRGIAEQRWHREALLSSAVSDSSPSSTRLDAEKLRRSARHRAHRDRLRPGEVQDAAAATGNARRQRSMQPNWRRPARSR